jgi:hypothetical protein
MTEYKGTDGTYLDDTYRAKHTLVSTLLTPAQWM